VTGKPEIELLWTRLNYDSNTSQEHNSNRSITLFGLQRELMASSFSSLLSLAPLTQFEQQELTEI
jgi:hypothetical protein